MSREIIVQNCVIDASRKGPVRIEKAGWVTISNRTIVVDDFVFVGQEADEPNEGGLAVAVAGVALDWAAERIESARP